MASADEPANGRPEIPDDDSEITQDARRLAGAAGDKLGGAADAAKTGLSGAAGAASDAASGVGNLGKAGLAGAAGVAGAAASGAKGAVSGVGNLGKAGVAGATGAAGKAVSGARSASLAGSGRGGKWPAWVPPNKNGKFPWKWRWLPLPLLIGACFLGGCMAWTGAEDHFGDKIAATHLACEFPDSLADESLTAQEAADAGLMKYDMSYRDVTIEGQLPQGVTQADVERVLEDGSTNTDCLERNGIDPDDGTGFRNIAVPAALAAVVAAPDPEPEPTVAPTPAPTAVPTAEPTEVPEPTATAVPEPEPTEVPAVIAAIKAKAEFDGQTIVLTGNVATEEQREQLVAAAIEQVGEDNVVDELTIDDGDASDTADTRIGELVSVMRYYGGDVTDGMAMTDDEALTYALNSPSDEARAALDLPGSGTVDVPQVAEPAFTG